MPRFTLPALCVCLVLGSAGCGGGGGRSDAGGCASGSVTCGSVCCNSVTEVCSVGRCVARNPCGDGQTVCGDSCCEVATQDCDSATATCVQRCSASQTLCGTGCCGAWQECASGQCKDVCAADQTLCGSTCCDNLATTCDTATATCVKRHGCPCQAGEVCCVEYNVCAKDEPGIVCPVPARYVNLATALEAERGKQGLPGQAVAVIEDGKLAWSMGFGTVSTASGAARVTSNTTFRSVAMAAIVTKLRALQLIEQGKLDLDGKLVSYAPEVTLASDPNNWLPEVTIRDLLLATSGLPADVQYWYNGPSTDNGLGDWVANKFPTAEYLMFPPGTFAPYYGNTEAKLLGFAEEKAGKKYFREAVKSSILDPLRMDRTFYLSADAFAAGDYATTVASQKTQDRAEMAPLSGPFSSVVDTSKALLFYLNGNSAILSDASRQNAMVPMVGTSADRNRYTLGAIACDGLNWNSNDYDLGVTSLVWGGTIFGFTTFAFIVPEKNFGFALYSVDPNGYGSWDALPELKALYRLIDVPDSAWQPVADKEDPATFSKYAGTYTTSIPGWNNPTVTVTLNGQTLHLAWQEKTSTQYQCDLVPLYPRNFTCAPQSSPGWWWFPQMYFELDASGNVTYVVTADFVAKRN